MLSKIKSTSNIGDQTRSSLSRASNAVAIDSEEEIDTTNDTNNNNNNNNNNAHNYQQTTTASKKTQDELLDIVELSRRRRLSKDSADSLSSFIRWSFSHLDPSVQRLATATIKDEQLMDRQEEEVDEDEIVDREGDDHDVGLLEGDQEGWSSPSQLRGDGSSTAANLALIKGAKRHMSLSSLLSESAQQAGNTKRLKTGQICSPEAKVFPPQTKKSSSYLGNVVDRLRQQQQRQQQQQQQQKQQQQQQQQFDDHEETNSGLSYHLQQFLQQQTSLEDLCSSVGLSDSNQQLALAAAIHRALLDSVNPQSALDTNSTASSTNSSNGSGSAIQSNISNTNNHHHLNSLSTALDAASDAASNLHLPLVDSTFNRQRRAYNTRAALHGGSLVANSLEPASQLAQIRQHQGVVGGGGLSINNRIQQQRHAQAAVALSTLANAGSQQLHQHNHHHHHQAATSATPIVDFECDTCGSSFDDRHRLMQHQSIHLELKKDWFTETPVDEVMIIFNRRRGEFLCDTCNLRFEATFDYDKHNHQVHGQRPYCCKFCGNGTRTFRFWRQYLNHLYDHRYIFSCTIDDCDFKVNRRDSLRFHIFRFHLNCQLPQNQQLRTGSGHNMLIGSGKNNNNINNNDNNNNNNCSDSKWPTMVDDEDNDT